MDFSRMTEAANKGRKAAGVYALRADELQEIMQMAHEGEHGILTAIDFAYSFGFYMGLKRRDAAQRIAKAAREE